MILILAGLVLIVAIIIIAVNVSKRRAWEKRLEDHKKANASHTTKVYYNKQ